MPTASWATFANGARQFVVHDALEITSCLSLSYWSSLTPSTIVGWGSVAGAGVAPRRRRGDPGLLRAGLEVLRGVVALGEEAGRLEHDLDAEVAPRQVRGIALLEDLDLLAVDDEAVAADLHLARIRPQDRVVLDQVGERRVVRDVVDRDPL